MPLIGKHEKTLRALFTDPVRSNIHWADIEALMMALGAGRDEGGGSRIRFVLNGIRATFHRPHPQKETDREPSSPSAVFWKKEVSGHDAVQGLHGKGRI
jgi:hypothetical protein